jgi:Fe-S cluster biogenesis protein NfuA
VEQPVVFVAGHPGSELSPVPGFPDSGIADRSGMEADLKEAIEAIRPALQADGGDISFVSVDEATGVVDVELVGACGSCPASTLTLKAGIERILKDRVEGVTEVNAIGLDPAF